MSSRLVPVLTLLACLCATVFAAPDAWADTWILVSDASEQPESALPEQTLAILEGLESEGHTVLFLAVGIDTKKRAKLVDLTKVLEEEGEESRLEVWAKRIERGKIDTDVAPDVLEALATATRIAPPEDPVHVLLLGRFGGIPDPPGDDEEDEASGLDLWAERGVDGDRVLTTHHLAERARERIAPARGYVETGWILLEAPTFTSEPRPWTPFGVVRDGKVRREPAAMEAKLMATVKAVGLGRSRRTASPLAVLQLKDESMRGWLTPGPDGIEISAPVNEARALTLAFGWNTMGDAFVLPLTEPPAPYELAFGAPVADFRWRDAEGPLASRTIALDDTGEVLLVLRHSNPEALASLELLEDDTPPGVTFEARAPMAGETFVDQIVRIGWKPARTLTLQRATLTLRARTDAAQEDVTLTLSARAPRVEVEAKGRSRTFRLPQASEKARAPFVVRAQNDTVPATLAMRATWSLPADSPTPALDLFLPDGTTKQIEAGQPFEVPVDVELGIAPRLAKAVDWARLHPGTVKIDVVPTGVLEVEGTLDLKLEPRRPSLTITPPRARVRLEDGVPSLEEPWVLTLDSDGGEGAWLLELMKAQPVVAALEDAPLAWQITPESPGQWRVEPKGTWTGAKAGAFDDAQAETRIDIQWPHGDAPRALPVEITVPARWGARGWIFVALAGLALALALFTFLKLRAPPIRGTLLYTVEGLEATVGRLDLAKVGRKATALRSDKRGKLGLGATGEAIALLRPTRVGGMLEIEAEDGEGTERRLLVDGLTLTTGRHTLRYLGGEPDPEDLERPLIEVPDLLGPDYDMEGGTFEDELDAAT